MRKVLIKLIDLYQNTPTHIHSSCKYVPTCSEYMKQAIIIHGSFKGTYLGIKRILRCNPLSKGGLDNVPTKENKMKKKLLLFLLLIPMCFLTTGCETDSMEGIDIVVTNYPTEYISKYLYGNHSNIESIYPDGINIDEYEVSKKQKKDYASKDLFIYNGSIEKERNLAIDLLKINPKLKIIDTAYILETEYSPEELWLNPSSLLMMSENVKIGLEEYASSAYLKKDIRNNKDNIKVDLSELDAKYREAVQNAPSKKIVVADATLKYLEKFGLEVICIDNDATDKTIANATALMQSKEISYIITLRNQKLSDIAEYILENNKNIKKLELHKLDILTDEERENKQDYLSIMDDNLNTLKQELYQ